MQATDEKLKLDSEGQIEARIIDIVGYSGKCLKSVAAETQVRGRKDCILSFNGPDMEVRYGTEDGPGLFIEPNPEQRADGFFIPIDGIDKYVEHSYLPIIQLNIEFKGIDWVIRFDIGEYR